MTMHVGEPEANAERDRLYQDDIDTDGYVTNHTRVWGWQPSLVDTLFEMMGSASEAAGLSFRDRGVLVVATAAGLGDSYCTLAWGERLAGVADVATAVGVVTDDLGALDEREQALARWARRVAREPNATTPADVDRLRAVGFDDAQIVALTAYVATRIAFATVNDALGAAPDHQLAARVPRALMDVIDFGRPAARSDQHSDPA